jgi:predicted membrane chloride channel (bestrophin family)
MSLPLSSQQILSSPFSTRNFIAIARLLILALKTYYPRWREAREAEKMLELHQQDRARYAKAKIMAKFAEFVNMLIDTQHT